MTERHSIKQTQSNWWLNKELLQYNILARLSFTSINRSSVIMVIEI